LKVRVALAVAVALLFGGAVAATYALAFATDAGRRADARIFNRIGRGDQSELRTELRKFGHRIGGRKLNVIAVIGVALVGAFLVVLSTLGRTRLRGLIVVVLIGGSFATTQIIKPALGDWGRHLAPLRVATDAFPSGHATLAMAIVLAGVMAVPVSGRLVATICGAALGTILGLLIVVGGLHPPSDVVGGYFVSGAWAAMLTPLLRAPPTLVEAGPMRKVRLRSFGIGAIVLAGLAFAAAVGIYVEYIFGIHRTLLLLVSGLALVSVVVVAVVGVLADLAETTRISGATLRPRRGVRVA
jgi:membrane-associated phospholipid phosphatase